MADPPRPLAFSTVSDAGGGGGSGGTVGPEQSPSGSRLLLLLWLVVQIVASSGVESRVIDRVRPRCLDDSR